MPQNFHNAWANWAQQPALDPLDLLEEPLPDELAAYVVQAGHAAAQAQGQPAHANLAFDVEVAAMKAQLMAAAAEFDLAPKKKLVKKAAPQLEINIKAKPTYKFYEILGEPVASLCKAIDYVGSSVTCNPAPATDIDVLCLIKPTVGLGDFEAIAVDNGWSAPDEMYENFVSLRKGKLNIIALREAFKYDLFIAARDVCKALNLMKKEDRITVHNIIMKGDWKKNY